MWDGKLINAHLPNKKNAGKRQHLNNNMVQTIKNLLPQNQL